MSERNQAIGRLGENLAANHMKQAGLNILERNYRCPVGEMDIIARDGEMLIFTEVRTRSSGKQGWGEESITLKKRERLNRIAAYYLKANHYKAWPLLRFDLIAIRSNGLTNTDSQPDIFWIRGI